MRADTRAAVEAHRAVVVAHRGGARCVAASGIDPMDLVQISRRLPSPLRDLFPALPYDAFK